VLVRGDTPVASPYHAPSRTENPWLPGGEALIPMVWPSRSSLKFSKSKELWHLGDGT
jgi:hypothetical protein